MIVLLGCSINLLASNMNIDCIHLSTGGVVGKNTIVKDSVLGLVGNHAVVIGIPVVAVCVEALLLMAVTGAVVKKRYTIKKSEAKTESEEK